MFYLRMNTVNAALFLVVMSFCIFTSTTAGAAWVNSDIADFPTGAKAPSYRDDFHRAVNYEWLSTAKIQKGEMLVGSFSERADEVEEQGKKLLRDRSLKSHEAALETMKMCHIEVV